MQTPSLFWVDPDRFSDLLAEVARDPRPSRSSTPPFSPRSEPHPARPSAKATPDVEPKPVQPASPSPQTAPQPEAPDTSDDKSAPFVLPDGPIEHRLEALVDWLCKTIPCEKAFVSDVEGLPLVESRAGLAEIVAAAALSKTWKDLVGQLNMALGDALVIRQNQEHFIILPQPSRFGLLTLGFVADRPITEKHLALIKEALNFLDDEVKESNLP